jgi:addiction module RelB/DinJ family antitoxin
MAMEATLQVRMDAEMKERVEQLYKQMGTTFAEAVRMMAAQSLLENGMPFAISAGRANAYGIAAGRANPALIPLEQGAFESAMVAKHVAD